MIWRTMVCSLVTALCKIFEKMREQGSLRVGKEVLPMEKVSCFSWQGAGGSHMEGKREAFIVLHPEVSKHFPEGLVLHEANSTGGMTWQLASALTTIKFPRHEAPDPWGLTAGAQKHLSVWTALVHAALTRAIEVLKMGAVCFLGAGQGVPSSPLYDAAFLLPVWGTEAKGRETFLVLFLAILERKKSNHGPWLVIFSWKQHKPELPASLIKLWIYRGPFIYIHLKCSLPGNWLWTEIIIWKDLTLRTVHSVLNAALVLHPFHRIPAWCVHHRGDSSRFYMCLLVGL